jgi:hypothetical protein
VRLDLPLRHPLGEGRSVGDVLVALNGKKPAARHR